ncbi:helix-turn-helix transcriptional regulator [Erysipelothrix sp. HDW6A]|uniref:helix-turn-helix domain-containing protein n=1 Tax=Erysipelothrix sp. HDW6A TaxID=2714928 RepID=UPI00140B5834|nr:helix-turn-helix transcriptional regulator [Erysipelothrix sp. HDW6A]QIK58107.1 helix-turn-helix transcriptional regulator [Erysipelothrix sp. HDW6A]
MAIKDLLKLNREKMGLTQEQLAEKIYVSRQAVSKWERGESLPDLENIILLSDLYDISIDQLLRGAKFLNKPFQIGEYKNSRRLTTGILLSILFASLASGGKYLIAFIVVLTMLLATTVISVMEGKILITKQGIKIVEYKNFIQKLISIFKPSNSVIEYSFDDIASFKIIYIKRRRLSPFDFNPDIFKIEFYTKSGQVYQQEASPYVTEHLPILCDYLNKKGITINDELDIVGMIVRGDNIYDSVHNKDTYLAKN